MSSNIHQLLNHVSEREREFRSRRFVAPYTKRSKSAVVKMDGANYTFYISGFTGTGFGLFQPTDPTNAKYVSDAPIELLESYFELLPAVHFILSYEVEFGWVAQPMNTESASKSIGLESEAVIHQVTDCERFDVVTARFDGQQFWFHRIFPGGNFIKSKEMRDRFVPTLGRGKIMRRLSEVHGLTPEDHRAFEMAVGSWEVFHKLTTEQQLQSLLSRGNAKLGGYVIRGANIEVRWKSQSGRNYTSLVSKDSMDVVSAGICLSGEDQKFHIKDLPFVISEGESDGRILTHSPWMNPGDSDLQNIQLYV